MAAKGCVIVNENALNPQVYEVLGTQHSAMLYSCYVDVF